MNLDRWTQVEIWSWDWLGRQPFIRQISINKKWKEGFCFHQCYFMRVSISQEFQSKLRYPIMLCKHYLSLGYHSTVHLHPLIGTPSNSEQQSMNETRVFLSQILPIQHNICQLVSTNHSLAFFHPIIVISRIVGKSSWCCDPAEFSGTFWNVSLVYKCVICYIYLLVCNRIRFIPSQTNVWLGFCNKNRVVHQVRKVRQIDLLTQLNQPRICFWGTSAQI